MAGAKAAARAGAGADAQSAARPSAAPFTLRDLLIAGAYHRRVILLVFLFTMLLGTAAAQLAPSTFDAEGRMMVLADRQGELGGLPSFLSGQSGRTMEAELEILRSRQVTQDAVLHFGADRLYPPSALDQLLEPVRELFAAAGLRREPGTLDAATIEAAERLQRDLRIAQTGNANVIRLGFAHPDRRLAIEVVDTVMLVYLSRRLELFEDLRSPFLSREVERYAAMLDDLEADIQAVKAEFDVLDLTQEVLLAVNQIDSIEHRRRTILERREALVAEVDAAERSFADLPERLFDYRETTNRTDNDEARNRLLLLRVERANLSERYADDYPRLQEIAQEIEAIREFSDRERPNYTSLREIRNPATDFLTNHLLTLQIEQEAVERQVVELDRQEERARQRIGELRAAERRLLELERSHEVVARIYREYAMQAEAARIDEDAMRQETANVRVIDWADAPLRSHSMALNFVLAGVFGGLLFGGLAGLGAAWNRQVFVLPAEVERVLAMPLLALFNRHQETARLPGGVDEVAFLATRILDHREGGHPLKTLQFLSPDAAETRRKLVFAVARELAASHGRRVLLLDLETAGASVGIELGTQRREVSGVALVDSEVAGLWVSRDAVQSPLGQTRTERSRLREGIQAIAADFDVVLLAVPNYGASHLGLRLAPTVDATLLVLRAEETRIPVALRMREEILDAGGDILGAVVTGRRFHLPRMVYRWL